jgi:site-specific DNA recombinase
VNIRRDVLEASVLNGLRQHFFEPALFAEFCEEFTREVNRLRMESGASVEAGRIELARIERDLPKLVQRVLNDRVPWCGVRACGFITLSGGLAGYVSRPWRAG